MGAGLRDVKRRIRSVQSTKKITRAMELIAASRVVKAQQRMQQTKPYADAITAALVQLEREGGASGLRHPYLVARDQVKAAAVIVVTSDRGMAGPYSSNVLRKAEELYGQLRSEHVVPKIYVTGRKGVSFYRFRDRQVTGSRVGFSESPQYEDAKAVVDLALDAYRAGEVDEIYVVFTHFVTAFTQRAVAQRLLPLEVPEVQEAPEGPGGEQHGGPSAAYDYEPDAETVLDRLLPRYIEARLFSAFLEACASEQAARRRAMSTATENATTLIESYTRQYNRARQAEITQELMEVVGAAEAFTSGSR